MVVSMSIVGRMLVNFLLDNYDIYVIIGEGSYDALPAGSDVNFHSPPIY